MNGGNPRRVAHRSPAVGEGWGTYRLSSSGVTPPSFRFTVAPDNKDQNQSGDACVRRMEYHSLGQRKRELADVLQLLLIQTEIVANFMDHGHADLLADFFLCGTDCFNVLLV